mmetsp:Transcript_8083/g.19574  ORF Transcript_8083/g.19574 Transcript_8083/m.19574 type:complete len:97 (+) Transcript_8083:20-310(+)
MYRTHKALPLQRSEKVVLAYPLTTKLVNRPNSSITKFQRITAGSIKMVPTATFAESTSSPILYCLPREKEAMEIGRTAMSTAAQAGSSLTSFRPKA